MSLASELAAKIRATAAGLAESRRILGTARERIAEAIGLVQNHTDGSSDLRPGEALTRFQTGIERLNEAEQDIAAAEEAMGQYVTEALGMNGVDTTTPPPAPEQPPQPTSGDREGFRPGQVDARLRGLIERIGWPKKPNGATDARGLLTDTRGKPLFRATLFAVRDGPANDTSDLKEPWASADLSTRFHIEGNVAAHMRRNGITEAVLYLNTAVCGGGSSGRPPDPRRCWANLADHLPAGTTLYTHAIMEDGSTRSRRFNGTGRALKR